MTSKAHSDFAARLNTALDHAKVPEGRGRRVYLSKLVGKTGEAARKWLAGETLPTMATAADLAEKLGVNVVWLLTGNGSMTVAAYIDSQPTQSRSDGLPFDGLGLSPEERVLLGIFARLTPDEKRKFLRELYEYKQKIDQAIDNYIQKGQKHS